MMERAAQEWEPLADPALVVSADGSFDLVAHVCARYHLADGAQLTGLHAALRAWDAQHDEERWRLVTCPALVALANDSTAHTTLPLFRRGVALHRAFRPRQLARIVAHSLLGNTRHCEDAEGAFGVLDWLQLYTSGLDVAPQRLLCVFDYLERAVVPEPEPRVVVFARHVLPREWPWPADHVLQSAHVKIHGQPMELPELQGAAFVDFANKKLQIHRMIPSLTQEEVLFSVASECTVALLCVDTLQDDEAFIMEGVLRHCAYTGYLDSFRYAGPLAPQPRPAVVLAIDALQANHFARSLRDIAKAYVGFAACSRPTISTGKWGCGVFGGDTSHKFLQQLAAAQVAGRELHYSSYGNREEQARYQELAALVAARRPTLGWLLERMTEYRPMGRSFHAYIVAHLQSLP